ncbi:MAG TPA: DUF6145 family protein [Lachnospiraceae bacterium]|nr:DUF6145 family protein [Lachnospiraceae bacterium]
MSEKRIILCGANAYEQKYYFNELFDGMPESVKVELRIICILHTQEAGGIFTIAFEEDGSLVLETTSEEDDICYDDISSGLLVGKIRRTKQELLESLSLFYKVFVLHEDISKILGDEI